jgi:hypothetical protein
MSRFLLIALVLLRYVVLRPRFEGLAFRHD